MHGQMWLCFFVWSCNKIGIAVTLLGRKMQKTLFEETHQNHFLFSDHYLNDILKKLDAWRKEQAVVEVKEKLRRRSL